MPFPVHVLLYHRRNRPILRGEAWAPDTPTAYWLEPAPNVPTATAAPHRPTAYTCTGIGHEPGATAYNAKHDN